MFNGLQLQSCQTTARAFGVGALMCIGSAGQFLASQARCTQPDIGRQSFVCMCFNSCSTKPQHRDGVAFALFRPLCVACPRGSTSLGSRPGFPVCFRYGCYGPEHQNISGTRPSQTRRKKRLKKERNILTDLMLHLQVLELSVSLGSSCGGSCGQVCSRRRAFHERIQLA